MTTDIEKQFFETFNIEKRQVDCGQPVRLGCENEDCKTCKYSVYEYPQITDRILLELICLCPDLDDVFFTDVKKLKKTLLNSYINIYNYYVNAEWLSDCEKELKHQVRTLFEEYRQ